MNRLVTAAEVAKELNEVVQRACAEAGIAPDEFWRSFVEAWNKAIDKDADEA